MRTSVWAWDAYILSFAINNRGEQIVNHDSYDMSHINDEIDGCGMNQFITVGHAGDTKIAIKLLLFGEAPRCEFHDSYL